MSSTPGDSPNVVSQTSKSFSWKAAARACSTDLARLGAHPCSSCPDCHDHASHTLLTTPAALWKNGMWKWIRGIGRGLWLWRKSSESWFFDHWKLCLLLLLLTEAHPVFVYRSAIRNAVRSAPLPTVHSAAVAPAATPRVSYVFCLLDTPNYSLPFLIWTFLAFSCQFFPRGYSCRYAVNDCDITETCSGDSGQVPPCDSYSTFIGSFSLLTRWACSMQLKCYTFACFPVPSEPSQARRLPLSGQPGTQLIMHF